MGRTKNKRVYGTRKQRTKKVSVMANDFEKFRQMNKKAFKNYVPTNEEEIKFYEAYKRVKQIKGFYIHAMVFIVINILNFIANYQELKPDESFFTIKMFSTFILWGIALFIHGLSVFLPSMILGNDWEERKIKQIMNQEKSRWE
jgi:hypothetical protein